MRRSSPSPTSLTLLDLRRGDETASIVGMPAVDIVVLTVIPPELEAARLALGVETQRPVAAEDGTAEFQAVVRSEVVGRDYRLVLACIGAAGNSGAAVVATRLLARHRPRALLLMGIAAGVRGRIRIGEVVLSDRVVAYEPAALVREAGDAKVQPRPEIDRAPFKMLQDVTAYRPDPERLRDLFARAGGTFPRAPEVKAELYGAEVAASIASRVGTIASGEKLLRDPAKLQALRAEVHGKVELGEMEAAGIVDACRPGAVPWLVVRGISDFGDEFKDDAFHGFAARAAAAVMVDFLGWGLNLPGPEGVATRRRNPFIIGVPIDRDEDFFGRDREKRDILEAIDKGEPVQLLGESRMGKSSLLRWVQRNALPGRPVVAVDPMADLTPASMVLGIARKLGRDALAARLARADATSVEAAVVLETLVPLVLVIDDAHVLASRGRGFNEGFFDVLRGLVQDRRLTWVSASKRNLYDLFKEKGLTSPFLNDSRKVWVGPLDEDAARALAGLGPAADVDGVVNEAGALAYGVQWLGDFLCRRRAFDKACDAFRDEAAAIFNRWWRAMSVEEGQLLQRCLPGLALDGLEEKTRRKLRRLVDRGFAAERDGSFVVEGAAWREFVADAS
jgi:nucleoside phosphorylase